MQIVIDIPEEKYDVIQSDLYSTFPAEMKEWGLEAIRNGTPLPKGHGRLIDAERIRIVRVPDSAIDDNIETTIWAIKQYISHLPTIIEADTENEDKDEHFMPVQSLTCDDINDIIDES